MSNEHVHPIMREVLESFGPPVERFVSPIEEQCRIADKALICIRHADVLMRSSNDVLIELSEFAAGHDMAKRHAESLTAAAAEIARLLKEGW